MIHTINTVYAKWIKNSVTGRFQNTIIEERSHWISNVIPQWTAADRMQSNNFHQN